MASSAADDSPLAHHSDSDLQGFFVLHKASNRKLEANSGRKTRRKIDLSQSFPKSPEKSEAKVAKCYDDQYYEKLRLEALDCVWSKIESTIKDVLRNINAHVFNEIDRWVQQSFESIRLRGTPDLNQATCSYPITTDVISKRLFAGLVFTKNMEFVDDLLTFADLGLHLKSHGRHVAYLSSLDFSAKSGIGGCLRRLLRQFLTVSIETADISVLASWYVEQGNNENPVVVIIEDMERCCGSVLSDFIILLSEWVVKIPIIVITGVATAIDAPRNILSANALQFLSPCKFILGSPAERLDAIIEAVLVKHCSGFTVGHRVATFLRNCFLRQDGTLSSLIRALKMAVVQHFSMEPLSFLLQELLHEEESQVVFRSAKVRSFMVVLLAILFCIPSYSYKSHGTRNTSYFQKRSSSEDLIFHLIGGTHNKYALLLLSLTCYAEDSSLSCAEPLVARNVLAETDGETWAHGLSELKRLQKLWSSVVLCLHEAGKCQKISLLDLYAEVLNPDLYNSRDSNHHLLEKGFRKPSGDQWVYRQYPSLRKGGFIFQAIRKVRDLPAASLGQLLKSWGKITEGVTEVCVCRRRHTAQSNANTEKSAKGLNEKAAMLMGSMVRDYLQPIECIPFHEICCFKDLDKLQLALIGDPRRRIQVDLLESHKFLKCSCCSKSGDIPSGPLPSMHDTTIMYSLALEHGDLINLHDWYQSFKATIRHPSNKGKHKLKQSISPKKRKDLDESQNRNEASVQARFCRAVIELQITGLLRMPSKRRPDYVQRVAFGL
ncbi:hypothetical protein RJ639_046537 [Escallonia herrerae]|uniref:Origin of replication complex subunit 3 n=1 Tax=Escallonia herrerae TaxID=1293975 RepID=A0AA89AYL2_9ASTE|nr:hypothetical protein RJ639_046537 [Escallonia herrerae]